MNNEEIIFQYILAIFRFRPLTLNNRIKNANAKSVTLFYLKKYLYLKRFDCFFLDSRGYLENLDPPSQT